MQNEMYFSIRDFAQSLENTALTFEEMLQQTEAEIRRVENLKIRIVDANSVANPEAMVRLSQQIDTYIFKLQQFLTEIPAVSVSEEIQSSKVVQQLRLQALAKIRQLGQDE